MLGLTPRANEGGGCGQKGVLKLAKVALRGSEGWGWLREARLAQTGCPEKEKRLTEGRTWFYIIS